MAMNPHPSSFPILNYVMSKLPSIAPKRSPSEFDIEHGPAPPSPNSSSAAKEPYFELTERMPHLTDSKVIAEMRSAIADVVHTRSILKTLGTRPDHESVDVAKAKLAEIDSNLSNQLDEISDGEDEDSLRKAAEREKQMYKAVISLDEAYESYAKLLKEAEVRLEKIYDSAVAGKAAVEEKVPPVVEEFDEEVVRILQDGIFEGAKRFELEDLLRASAEMLGKGGLGTAYKAVLADGNVVAVKRPKEAGIATKSGSARIIHFLKILISWRSSLSGNLMTTAASALTPTPTTAGFCCSSKSNNQKWLLSTKSKDGGTHYYAKRNSSLVIFARPATSSSSTTETSKKKQRNNKKKENEEKDEKEDAEEEDNVGDQMMKKLDDVNPVGLGRKSRQIFDEVWRKFSNLGQISRTTRTDDESSILIREGGPMCEFAIPGAQNTTVLVVGATSRVWPYCGQKTYA